MHRVYVSIGLVIKAGFHMKAIFWLGIIVLMKIQAVKNLYAHPIYLCFGPFSRFFGDF